MNSHPRWSSQAFLDALRPEFGWAVKCAILASYSADLPSIGAALLGLAGLDSEGGSGSKAALAEAIERLRGKVRIIVQRGRLARPKRIPPITGILDQFLREVPFDERAQSWHPKVSLVQFVHPEAGSRWHIWLGSRNLTSAENRDIGLLLVSAGAESRNPLEIPGVGKLAECLAAHAGLNGVKPLRIKAELDRCRWLQPAKMRVEKIELVAGNSRHDIPSPPKNIDEVIVVSPFLDGTTVARIGRWGDAKTKRSLLSTLPELAKIAGQTAKPLAGFSQNIFSLDKPPAESADPETTEAETPAARGEAAIQEEIRLGLHAKIIAIRKGKNLRMWVGSANATQRAWGGINTEIIAEIAADVSVQDGLLELLGQGTPATIESLAAMEREEVDSVAERLDCARKTIVAEWTGELVREGNDFTLSCKRPPHPNDAEVELEAGLATGALLAWPRASATLALGNISTALQTALLQLRLRLGDIHCTWMQKVPVTPALEAGRDHAAFAKYLGANQFLEWIAALLDGSSALGTFEADWDQPAVGIHDRKSIWSDPLALSLETMLACWTRDPQTFERVDARLKSYLDPIIAQAEAEESQDLQRLLEFQAVWKTVGSTLLKKR